MRPRPDDTHPLLLIGLTGEVGAGKSAAAEALERLGCARFDADRAAQDALDRPEVIAALRGWWGDGVVGADGRVDRSRVAAIVFNDDAQRRRLEGLIHPIVIEEMVGAMREAVRAGRRSMALDIPLLHEAGLDAWCDAVFFIEAPREVRLQRVRSARGWTEEDLARREAAQAPAQEKRRRAASVIANDADRTTLNRRVEDAFRALEAREKDPAREEPAS